MECPKDHISLKTVSFGSHTIDVCGLCGGIWLDFQELKNATDIFLSSYELHKEKLISSVQTNQSGLSTYQKTDGILCPHDFIMTERVVYAGDSGIVIDRCGQCGGVWFDGDELVKLAEYLKPDAYDLLGEYMLQEEKRSKEELTAFKNMLFFPLRIGALFATPFAILAEIVFFILHHTNIDLGTDVSKHLPRKHL